MITLEEYKKDPCGSLSVPYWKWKGLALPENMAIVHRRDYRAEDWPEYRDEPYFRLSCRMEDAVAPALFGYTIRTAADADIPVIAEVINGSYPDIRVSVEYVRSLTSTPVYAPVLWILAEEDESGKTVGCAIADLDREAEEGILEWVQVLPEYRAQGIGRLMVRELLRRMKGKAEIATVSGQCGNPTRPEALYRACGFAGQDVWHILHKK